MPFVCLVRLLWTPPCTPARLYHHVPLRASAAPSTLTRLEPSTDIEQRAAAAAVVVVVVGVESGDLLPPSVSPSISPILGLTCSGILEAAGSQSSAP